MLARPMNRPCATTPGIRLSKPARRGASLIRPRWASMIQWPPSVTKTWPSLPFRTPVCPETPVSANAAAMARSVAARPNGITSTGRGKRPRTSTHLVSSAITIMRTAAAALDRMERGIHLVGAINGDVQPVDVVERGQRDSALFGLGAGRFRSRHAHDFHAGADLFAEQVDEMFCGRTGAEPELHAVLDMLQRARRGLPFQCVHVHVTTMPLKFDRSCKSRLILRAHI